MNGEEVLMRTIKEAVRRYLADVDRQRNAEGRHDSRPFTASGRHCITCRCIPTAISPTQVATIHPYRPETPPVTPRVVLPPEHHDPLPGDDVLFQPEAVDENQDDDDDGVDEMIDNLMAEILMENNVPDQQAEEQGPAGPIVISDEDDPPDVGGIQEDAISNEDTLIEPPTPRRRRRRIQRPSGDSDPSDEEWTPPSSRRRRQSNFTDDGAGTSREPVRDFDVSVPSTSGNNRFLSSSSENEQNYTGDEEDSTGSIATARNWMRRLAPESGGRLPDEPDDWSHGSRFYENDFRDTNESDDNERSRGDNDEAERRNQGM